MLGLVADIPLFRLSNIIEVKVLVELAENVVLPIM